MKKRQRKKWIVKFGFIGWTFTPARKRDPVGYWQRLHLLSNKRRNAADSRKEQGFT